MSLLLLGEIEIPSPNGKEISHDARISEFVDQGGNIVLEESLDHSPKLGGSLFDGGMASTEYGALFGEHWNVLVNITSYRVRVWAGRKRFPRRRLVLLVEAFFSDALSTEEALPFASCHTTVLELKISLEPQAIIPATPNFVFGVGASRSDGSSVSKDDGRYSHSIAVAST